VVTAGAGTRGVVADVLEGLIRRWREALVRSAGLQHWLGRDVFAGEEKGNRCSCGVFTGCPPNRFCMVIFEGHRYG
jgi:hypothetical protein